MWDVNSGILEVVMLCHTLEANHGHDGIIIVIPGHRT